MTTEQDIVDAILQRAGAAWEDGPVVWPNEQYDPDVPSGRFSTFPPGSEFAAVQIRFDAAGRETHGATNGLRFRVGEVSVWIYSAGGTGPGRGLEIAHAFAASFRDARLLSDEVQFHDPVVDIFGEGDDQRFVTLVRSPFTAWSANP